MKKDQLTELFKAIKFLKIGGHRIKIKYPFDFKEERKIGDSNCQEGLIRIAGKDCEGSVLSFTKLVAALLHEVFHFLDWDIRRDLFESENDDETAAKEDGLDALMEALLQLFVDNPRLGNLIQGLSKRK